MGDMAEEFRALRHLRKSRHDDWDRKNREILDKSGLPFDDRGTALLFREPGKPKVDFYPSTGRWRLVVENRTFSGGAESFLNWYRKQKI